MLRKPRPTVTRECNHVYVWSSYCGCYVCCKCGDHRGLTRCFCGWSKTTPGRGRQELEEMGETIEET